MTEQSMLTSLLERLKKPGFVKDIFTVSSGSALSQLLVIAASPLLMRIYSPAELGIQAICMSLLLVTVVNTLRYNQGIPLPESTTESLELVLVSLIVLATTTTVVGAILFLTIDAISVFTQTPTIGEFTILLVAIFFLSGAMEVMIGISIRLKKFNALGQAQVVQTVSQLAYQIIMGLQEPSARNLVIGLLVGHVFSTLVYIYCIYSCRDQLIYNEPKGIWEAAKKHKNFPLLASPSQLINSASVKGVPIFLAAFYSPEVVGLLALAQRVIGLPLTAIGYGVSQVFFQRSAVTQIESPRELLNLYTRTAKGLFILSIAPISVIALSGPWLFKMIFGENWADAGLYAAILAPMFMVQFAVSPLSQIMAVISAQRGQLVWDSTRLVVVSTVVFTAGYLEFEATYCIALYGTSMALCYVWLFMLTRREIAAKNDLP